MIDQDSDALFSGSVPKLYEKYLVPLAFQPYAPELVKRLTGGPFARVLEIAAGTGVVTRALAEALPETTQIVATDLNEGMVAEARSIGTKRPVEWQQADAMELPFPNESFDAGICQFGVMFFPDKAAAFREVHRVLRPGGIFLFDVWDRIEENDFPHTVTGAIASLFPDNPPRFHARVPHGYHSPDVIARDLAAAGFTNKPQIETVTQVSRARAPHIPAMAYCQGTPLRNEIEERDPMLLSDATSLAAKAIAEKFGTANISGKIQALVVRVTK